MPIGDPAAVTPTGVDGKVINRHLEQRLSRSHGTDTTRGQAGTRIGLIGYKAGLTIKQACATRCRRSRPMALTLATWNVNSLKVRLPHLLDWLGAHAVDVMCLQETKLPDDKFPVEPLQQAGYESVFAGQKTYNGVAILTRRATVGAATDVQANLPNFEDEQKRLIAATVAGVRVVCCYFPNGQAVGSDKYEYKLRWIAALNQWLRDELLRSPQLAVLGDYNVAPEDRDVHDPKAWEGQVLFSEPEKQAFRDLVALGLVDSFRMFEQPERSYTWWDYRMMAFRRKMGLRIDHVLLSPALAARCTQCTIDVEPRRREQPSDHAPVVVTLQ